MVWYGMVWYGMVWYGMVWYGMVWYGMVWYGMVWYGMVWYGMVWYRTLGSSKMPAFFSFFLKHTPTSRTTEQRTSCSVRTPDVVHRPARHFRHAPHVFGG